MIERWIHWTDWIYWTDNNDYNNFTKDNWNDCIIGMIIDYASWITWIIQDKGLMGLH